MALYEAEPWGPVRSDLAAGMVASTIANVNRGKDSPPFSALDFAPFVRPPEQEQEATTAEFLHLVGV